MAAINASGAGRATPSVVSGKRAAWQSAPNVSFWSGLFWGYRSTGSGFAPRPAPRPRSGFTARREPAAPTPSTCGRHSKEWSNATKLPLAVVEKASAGGVRQGKSSSLVFSSTTGRSRSSRCRLAVAGALSAWSVPILVLGVCTILTTGKPTHRWPCAENTSSCARTGDARKGGTISTALRGSGAMQSTGYTLTEAYPENCLVSRIYG